MGINQPQIQFKSNLSTVSLLRSWQKSMYPMIIMTVSSKHQMLVSCKRHLYSISPTKTASVKRILRSLKNLIQALKENDSTRTIKVLQN